MEGQYYKEYSQYLDREMEFKMYGHDGMLCLVLPCQDGRFYEWEDRNMYELVQPMIDQGIVQFVSVDTIDRETWSAGDDSARRMRLQEDWVNYLLRELIPSAKEKAGVDPDEKIMVMGASMGASHAVNLFLRFPDQISKVLALSGLYDLSRYIYDGNFDGNFYQNCPLAYLPNMQHNHPYIDLYNHSDAVIVVGKGDWEFECHDSTVALQQACEANGIHLRFEYWGYDIPHDWPSWEKQLQVYLPEMLLKEAPKAQKEELTEAEAGVLQSESADAQAAVAQL